MAEDIARQTPAQIMAEAPNLHPAALYILASKLLAEGRPDEAVRWFYIGQIRYRYHLMSDPAIVGNDQPLFSAMNESIGRPINEYAFGDVDAAVAEIDAALAWDDANPNNFTPKDRNPEKLAELRTGLKAMRDDMLANREMIRETRTRNGLENR